MVSISHSESEKEIPPKLAILLADILPTGYFAAVQAFRHPNLSASLDRGERNGFMDSLYLKEIENLPNPDSGYEIRFAIIGLGPVGLVSAAIGFQVMQHIISDLLFSVP